MPAFIMIGSMIMVEAVAVGAVAAGAVVVGAVVVGHHDFKGSQS
jgi:hypothetical protein